MYPEFLVDSGPKLRHWLKDFFSDIMENFVVPSDFRRTIISASLYPGKNAIFLRNFDVPLSSATVRSYWKDSNKNYILPLML